MIDDDNNKGEEEGTEIHGDRIFIIISYLGIYTLWLARREKCGKMSIQLIWRETDYTKAMVELRFLQGQCEREMVVQDAVSSLPLGNGP